MKEKLFNAFLTCLCVICNGIIRLRYRINVEGLDHLMKEKGKGTLFLPNHPAQIDPVIIMLLLWRKFRPRPLVIDYFYYLKGVNFLMRFVKALPLPSLDASANKWKLKRVEKLFNKISNELNSGESFLIYPSGHLKLTPKEIVGGASFVPDLLNNCHDMNVVLVRITGLWGSSFSSALTGKVPDFGQAFKHGFKVIMKNLIFFAPRRDLKVEFVPAPEDFPRHGGRIEINKYLENWYNNYPEPGEEPLKLVSYSVWKKEFPEITTREEHQRKLEDINVPEPVKKAIYKKIAQLSQVPPESLSINKHLSIDLGLDSLDTAQIYVFLDERYDVTGVIPGELQTVGDVLCAAVGKKEQVEKHEKGLPQRALWPDEPNRPPVSLPKGSTIAESFLLAAERMDKHMCCADLLSGMLSYRKFKLAALLLADKIEKLPAKNIGILLPSSVGGYLTIAAVLLAGKVPVMLNWTAGIRSLNHATEITELFHVLTSRRFLDNLHGGDLGVIEDHFVFLEDLKSQISLGDKLSGVFKARKKTSAIMKARGLDAIDEHDPAVVLFTSGTESLPKAVPLSHYNILNNQRGAMTCMDFKAEDVLYGILPPFHSFGFNVTGLFPILAGMRACFSPDPTDSHKLAKEIEHWGVSIFCSAPSFIKMLFQVAKPENLKSLRLMVSGAERTPLDLFDQARKLNPNTIVMEGYGITECSPVVTLMRPDKPHVGVGGPVPGVEICIISPETEKVIDSSKDGEICIHGPNVFQGYLASSKNPFIIIDGKKWYRSGDRGHLDPATGSLVLSGRLKRFVKIGGEMVSLGGLEQQLLSLAQEKGWEDRALKEGPPLAISVIEKENEKPQIVLFTTFELSRETANIALKESGYGRIIKIGEVRRLEEIPLTGTGKTHYRVLDEMLEMNHFA